MYDFGGRGFLAFHGSSQSLVVPLSYSVVMLAVNDLSLFRVLDCPKTDW